jgi:glucose-1-phosphate thymidylyltransferase
LLTHTLIRADFDLDPQADAVIWVKQVDQPEAYGVVKLNDANGRVGRKPQDFVNLAVIGIYYFKVGDLKQELKCFRQQH